MWQHNVILLDNDSNIPHLSYTVGTQYVGMLPDSSVNIQTIDEGAYVYPIGAMDVCLKSIGIVPPKQMGFSKVYPTNTFELYHFDKLSSDINSLDEIEEGELSSYDVLVKHKKPHPKTEDDSIYEG